MILTVLYGRLSSRTTSAGGRRTLRCFKRDKNGCTLNQREATEELFSVMRQRVGGPRQNSREISQEERRKKTQQELVDPPKSSVTEMLTLAAEKRAVR